MKNFENVDFFVPALGLEIVDFLASLFRLNFCDQFNLHHGVQVDVWEGSLSMFLSNLNTSHTHTHTHV